MTQRWKQRPHGSNWGDFGADDEKGRLNLLTPAKVLEGVAEVKTGGSFCLSLPLDYPGGNALSPTRRPPRRFASDRNGHANFNFALRRENPDFTDVITDDAILVHTQYSTQWDSLAHYGTLFDADGDGVPEIVYYNGWRGGEHVIGVADGSAAGDGCLAHEGVAAEALGIENMAATGVQGRGVLIDLCAHFGRDYRRVGYEDILTVMEADGVSVEQGDMVCLHTGFADVVLEMQRDPDPKVLKSSCCALDGRDRELHRWITESGLAVLIADNYAVEAYPSVPGEAPFAALPLHEHCIFKLGIHLGELWHLGPLAAWLRQHRRNRFLLTAPPLRLPGAVGSPVTPVATV